MKLVNKKWVMILIVTMIFTAACGGSTPEAATPTITPEAETAPEDTTNTPVPPTEASTPTEAVEEEATIAELEESASEVELAKNGKPLLESKPPFPFDPIWQTNFFRHTVPYDEILSGGVPRDGIPPIDNPTFVDIADAETWIEDQEPIFVVSLNDETKGYPLQIMIWHEIVNDTIGGEPVTVTYCPLCNSAITFERTLNGIVYDFGVSGMLRNSDLIMWDRQTQSWWQQLTGESIVGELVGEQLKFVPSHLVSFGEFKTSFPDAEVLSRETGFRRSYGQNPYGGYDSAPNPFLFSGPTDDRLQAVDRIVAVDLNGDLVAYPYQLLSEQKVVADTVGNEEIVIFWEAGTTSALDAASIAGSRDVGAASVYSPLVDDQTLTFTWDGMSFVDDQTGSSWNLLGKATDGELVGSQLEPVVHANHLWFALSAFYPDTRIYSP